MRVERLLIDTETPISIFLKLKASGFQPLYLLESAEEPEKWGRYSFLGFGEPKVKIKYFIDEKEIEERDKEREKENEKSKKNKKKFLDILEEELNKIKIKHSEFLQGFKKESGIQRVPFGLVGFIGYDLFSEFDKVNTIKGKVSLGIPDSVLVFTPNIIIFDNLKRDIILLSEDVSMAEIKKVLKKSVDPSTKKFKVKRIHDKVKKEEFEDIVKKGIQRIYMGDVIQVVLSRQKEIEIKGKIDEFSLYRILRIKNPSPYMYFADFDDIKIVGTSPEILVRVENGVATTLPIAGTRKRGETEEEDKKLEEELLSDEKELAEHVMLVDLARNDIGKASYPGTVKVKKFAYIKKLSRVMHIVSEVEGKIKETPLEVLRSCFPAGTVVGAPKIEAAKIISELEKERRGPYAGAIGYFSADNNMDTAILIRTAFIYENKIKIQAGAGIVFYSIPEREYFETEHKLKALEESINVLAE
jgi:anthranilate synthase component 1